MPNLIGLEGVSAPEVECVFIESPNEITVVLLSSKACTAAGPSGAINIWFDDGGLVRCESMRYCRTIEKKIYKSINPAKKWADKWLELIK